MLRKHTLISASISAFFVLLVNFPLVSPSAAAEIIVVNNDGPNEGFNDPTPVTPLPGNAGTTLGEQRLNAFNAAAEVWEQILETAVAIRVGANMDPLECSPTQGVLGAAGPESAFRNFTNAPRDDTWYPGALANSLAGSDLDPGVDDIGAQFNSDVDGNDANCLTGVSWWYGVGAAAPSGTISFFDTILHEIGHGIGFLTFVNSTTGQKFLGRDDIYMTFLEDESGGMAWPNMTDAQRAASATDTGDLHWIGPQADACGQEILTNGISNGHVQMYAPNPVELGSSVSHWDTALAPDELMEPFATPSSDQRLTEGLLRDIGWGISSPSCSGVIGDDDIVEIPISPPLNQGSISEPKMVNTFKFTVVTAGTYTMETEGETASVDTVMSLFGPASQTTPLEENDDIGQGNLNSRITTSLDPGMYQIKVKLYNDNQIGNYTIFVRKDE